jgi:hypothetical protein
VQFLFLELKTLEPRSCRVSGWQYDDGEAKVSAYFFV